MTGDAPATIVWIAAAPPNAGEAKALTSWAQAHGRELTPPSDERPPTLPVDLVVADEVEELLDRAHDAITARDGDGSERAVEAAEALLRVHPELPQAAWLMAEVERARSTMWRRIAPPDADAAERAWLRAEALDAGRVSGLGEVGSASHPFPSTIALALPGDDRAELDGQRAATVVVTRAGPHALVVKADGAPVWAEWIEAPIGASTMRVDAPTTKPCSSADAAHARLVDGAIRGDLVRCPRWVVATSGQQPGTIRVALCEGDRCGPLLEGRDPPLWTRPLPANPVSESTNSRDRASRWPGWATWVLAGAGVAIAGGVGIVASGALKPAPTGTRFVNGGLKAQ